MTVSKKPTEPGYYWATGPLWDREAFRQIVYVKRNALPDKTVPDALSVLRIADLGPYSVGDFKDWAGPIVEK